MRTKPGRPTRALILLGVSAFALGAFPAVAQSPQGGTVASGAARISQTTRQSTIRQTSERAVIDWKSFDVGRAHRVVFDQPGKSSATLNRVNSVSKSVIQGSITAPGTVIIQNTAGVLFSKGAKLDLGGLVATSQTVDAARFQQGGGLAIGGGERPGARVVNQGEVTIGETGLAALVGGNVENAGAIYARTGTVALASGTRTTIDLNGDGAIQIAVDGNPARGGVVNSGLIDAGAGRVLLTAGDAASAIDSVINTTGVIRAGSSSGSGGRVELTGRGSGKVRIGGTVSAAGATGGGSVTVTGETVAVEGAARIGARGGHDGGNVRIGGDLRGKGPLRRADHVTIAEGAVITATGETGRGGTVIAWADGTTIFDGRIAAEGGAGGGLVETSGKFALAIGPLAAVSTGAGGTWLLDPRNVEIDNGGAAVSPGVNNPPDGPGIWTVNTNSLRQALNAGGKVVITTDADGTTPGNPGNSDGDIVFRRALNWTGSGDLTLLADGDVVFDASVSTKDGDFTATAGEDLRITNAIQSSGTGNLILTAGEAIAIDADVRATGTGRIAMLARKGDIIGTWRPAGNLRVTTRSGDLDLEATEGSVVLRRFSTASADNIQVFSDSGDLNVTAGDRIRIQGESASGRWVRLGSSGSSGDVTLTAPWIKVFGGSADNTFAEVAAGEGGSITMNAGTILLRNGVSEGRVAALNRADLAMRAETQSWDGPVRAGTGGDNGGNVALSGAITALVEPLFGLAANRTFVLEPSTPGGAPSSYASSVRLGVSTSGTGTVEIGAPVEAAQIALISQERVGIGAGAGLRATGAGDSLVVAAGRQFRNDAGTDALETTTGGARWLLYIDRFDGLVGAEPTSGNFDLYGRLFADTPPSLVTYGGNRIIYGERPVLTITGDTLDKTYGTAVTPGLTVAGLRPGDSLGTALATGPDVASDGAAATAPVGSYATDVTATPSDQGYRLDLRDGLLTVDPALLTITADDKSRIYGSANPPLTASYSGFVLGQGIADLDGTLTLATAATQASDAGSYAITASGQSSDNYAISYVDGTMSVGKAALSVVVDDKSRTYGAANPSLTATFTGFVLGQDASVLGGALTTNATQASNAGRYAITGDTLTSRNYAITSTDGTMTVGKAALSVVVDDKSKTYGAANPTLTASYSGFVLGQDASVLGGSLTTTATQGSDAGRYTITGDTLTSRNYAITSTDGTMTVGKAALRVVVDDKSKTYGAANPTLTASYSGFVLGQDASVLGGSLTTTATQGSDAGRYTITGDTLTSRNYAITSTDGTMTVGKAALSVVVDDKSKTYGAANPTLTASYSGFVLGQDASVLGGSLTTTATQGSDAGRYAITGDTLTSRNYAITSTDGTMTVGKAALSVVVDDKSKTYGAANPTLTASYSGFVLGQDASVLGGSLTTTATRTSDAGRYTITGDTLTSRNYAITSTDGTMTVAKAALRVVANDASRPEGSANPPFTATISGFVLDQSIADLGGELAFATPATPASPAGSYAITPEGLASRNYAIAYVDGLLTVTPGGAQPQAPAPFGIAGAAERFERGVPPLTPGDATFRTTIAEAPPALADPFLLTYSLGDVVQYVPAASAAPAGADAQGFVPASGGLAEGGLAQGGSADCSGPINRAGSEAGCTRQTFAESFWTTRAEESQ